MLKQTILSTNSFIDNKYLKKYLMLINKTFLISGYCELHHVIPVAYYKYKDRITFKQARIAANADLNNEIIKLSFKDHCVAHYLLCKCTTGKLQLASIRAFISMTANKIDYTKVNLSKSDYIYLQKLATEVRALSNTFWSDTDIQWLISNSANYTISEIAVILHKT